MPKRTTRRKEIKTPPKQGGEVAELLPYTVVLMTPDYLANQYGEDVETCHVFGENRIKAIMNARMKAQEKLDALEHDPDDFAALFVCHGHQANIAP